jgi:hypothetical protein
MEYQKKLIILPAIQDMKEPITVTAHEAVGTGLCYNAIGGNKEDGFVITHLASKKALCKPIGTEYEVRLVMEKIVGITDWWQNEEELQKKPWIGTEFRDCQQTVEGDLNMQLETAMKDACMPDYLVEKIMEEMEEDEYPILRNALLYAFKIVPSKLDSLE